MAKTYSRNNPLSSSDSLRNLSALFGPSDDIRFQTVEHLSELVASIGVSRAFSNHPDLPKLLSKIQHKLENISFIIENKIAPTDPSALSAINQADLLGLNNCIAYFGSNLSLNLKKIIPGQNKAGAIMRLSHVSAKRAYATLSKINDADNNYGIITEFVNKLSQLLLIFERLEYQVANLPEEYWN